MNLKDSHAGNTGMETTNPHTTVAYAAGLMCLIALLFLAAKSSPSPYPENGFTRNQDRSIENMRPFSLDIMMFKHLFQYAKGPKSDFSHTRPDCIGT